MCYPLLSHAAFLLDPGDLYEMSLRFNDSQITSTVRWGLFGSVRCNGGSANVISAICPSNRDFTATEALASTRPIAETVSGSSPLHTGHRHAYWQRLDIGATSFLLLEAMHDLESRESGDHHCQGK
jgi:hypothetical protein